MVNNWGLWGQDSAINSNGSIFHHRREIKIAHRQGEGSQAGRLKQIMVDISATVLLRRWVPCSRTQAEPTLTLSVQNVTRRWAVWDNFFADDVVLLRVTSRHQRHRTLIFLSSLSSIALPPPFLSTLLSLHISLCFSSPLTGGEEEEGGRRMKGVHLMTLSSAVLFSFKY